MVPQRSMFAGCGQVSVHKTPVFKRMQIVALHWVSSRVCCRPSTSLLGVSPLWR